MRSQLLNVTIDDDFSSRLLLTKSMISLALELLFSQFKYCWKNNSKLYNFSYRNISSSIQINFKCGLEIDITVKSLLNFSTVSFQL